MSDINNLEETHHFILSTFVKNGFGPHYTEIAEYLGISPEDGRKTLHEVFKAGVFGWLYPKTDLISSYAPFNNQPTQFRISIDGEQKWFAQ